MASKHDEHDKHDREFWHTVWITIICVLALILAIYFMKPWEM